MTSIMHVMLSPSLEPSSIPLIATIKTHPYSLNAIFSTSFLQASPFALSGHSHLDNWECVYY